VAESTRGSGEPGSRLREFSAVVTGFDVVDRNGERIGRVRDVSLGRTCILVDTGRGALLRRKQRHAVHVWAVREIDVGTYRISLAATKEDVAEAPEFREFDEECETALARYYYDRLAALGENVDADA
jgi:sporulation protein YlmC with PRC-barrel domain